MKKIILAVTVLLVSTVAQANDHYNQVFNQAMWESSRSPNNNDRKIRDLENKVNRMQRNNDPYCDSGWYLASDGLCYENKPPKRQTNGDPAYEFGRALGELFSK